MMIALRLSVDAAVFFGQEHHAGGSTFVDLQHEARQLGWTAEGALACIAAKDGSSVGVAVIAKKGIG